MRKLLFFFFLFSFILVNANAVQAEEVDTPNAERQLVIQTHDPEWIQSTFPTLLEVPTSTVLKENGIHVLEVPSNLNFDQIYQQLLHHEGVIRVEPNEVRTIEGNVSQEPYYREQQYFNTINLLKAFPSINLNQTIKVAVLDTGVDASHPELQGRVLPGYDFYNRDGNPSDDHGHGTFVSGIIAANLDGKGIAGMAPNVSILPIKVANSDGDLLSTNIIEGIYYAIDQQVDVINMSYGGNVRNSLEEQALQRAYDAGITLVAAAGNDGVSTAVYPAFYPTVINVGAANNLLSSGYVPSRVRASFSNYGVMMDVGAPGVGIIGPSLGGTYSKGDGTSFAAPMVSGLAAMIKSIHPTWSPAQIEWAIEKGALNGNYTTGAWEQQLGYGIMDAYQSLILAGPDLSRDAANYKSGASSLPWNTEVSQSIELPMDIDWYQVDVPMNMNVTISGTSNVLNLKGELYKENTKVATLWNGTNKGAVTLQLSKGTYSLKVFEEQSHWSDLPYTLKIAGDVTVRFTDITESYTHFDGIQALVKMGSINGYPMPDGTRKFRPENKLTREHAAKIFANALQLPVPTDVSAVMRNFTDVNEKHEYAPEIAATYEAGIFRGNNGRFMPGYLSREQMATIIVRAFGLTDNGQKTTVDLSNVSPTHQENVKILKQYGITTEDNFRPSEYVTRAQFASFVYRAMNATSL